MNRVEFESVTAMHSARMYVELAEDAEQRGELAEALQLAQQARTHERMAEYTAVAAMLGKDVKPRE